MKCILKYLRKTNDYMLIYDSDELIPVRYMDFDFMLDKDPRKLTSGVCVYAWRQSYQLEEY